MIKPIIFNTDMVRAILDGRKTVTRRVCKDGDDYTVPDMGFYDADKRTYAVHSFADREHTDSLSTAERTCPICPGDILWVRETWEVFRTYPSIFGFDVLYAADQIINSCIFQDMNRYLEKFLKYEEKKGWNTPYSMPKEAARIWLKVTGVRVEPLWSITEEQAKAEGANWKDGKNAGGEEKMRRSAVERFAEIWNSTIKKPDLSRYGWEANPWVWVIGFERCEKPEGV